MTSVGVSVATNEFDAAQALLDLQSNVRENKPETRDARLLLDCKEDMEKSATYFLSCFLKPLPTNTAVPTVERHAYALEKSDAKDPSVKKTSKRKYDTDHDYLYYDSRAESQSNENYSKKRTRRSIIFNRIPKKYSVESSVNQTISPEVHTQTANQLETKSYSRDIGTQTEEEYQPEIVKTMGRTIDKLYEKIHSLEDQIRANAEILNSIEQDVSDDDIDLAEVNNVSYESKADNDSNMTINESHNLESDEDDEITNSCAEVRGNDPDYKVGQDTKSKKVLRNRNINANVSDMVPIGDGNSMIPSRIYRHINWNSYTSATRKLLTAVFSRKVLATHSLTGKPSPAFPNKPAKKKLDSSLVNDIVQAVVENCKVPENVVRTSITTKCADESKMFRTRQQNKKKLKFKLNTENIPPESESDDD